VTIRETLENVNVETFIFEDDAGARTESSENVYVSEVENCDIYVGIFRAEYSRATEQEYRIANAKKKEILVYVSDYNADNRDERLKNIINEVKDSHTIEKFQDVKDLAFEVHRDITGLLVRYFKEHQKNRIHGCNTALDDASTVESYLKTMASEIPSSLSDTYLVAGEIMAIWKAIGYKITKTEIRDDAIDFETEISHWSGDKKALVRCVNGEISVQDVDFVKKFLIRNPEYQGFIFTFNRISTSAKMLAAESPIVSVQTQAEFYRKLMKPEKYISYLKGIYANSDIPQYYVNLDCYKEEFREGESGFLKESSGDLENYVDKWLLDKSKKHISILGEFGTGKTWFCKRYGAKSLDKYLENPDINRLPIFISLRDYAKSYSIQQMITDLLVNEYEFTNNTGAFKVFEELNRQGKFLLIFDGFDEMAQKVDYGVVVNNFWELAKVAVPNSKVLLTCRTTHFRYALESQKVLGGKEKGSTILPTNQAGFEILHLEEFSEEKIVDVMSKRLGNREQAYDYWCKLKPIYDIPSIAHKPVLIPMLIDVMSEIVASPRVNPALIYHIYTDRWINQSIAEQRSYLRTRWDKLYFMTELAWHMIKTQNLKISWKDIPSFINENFHVPSKELDYYEHDLRNNSFLKRDHEGIFEFSHKSMAEFFVAYKFALELGAAKSEYLDGIPAERTKQMPLLQLSDKFGYALLTPEIALFLQDMITHKDTLKDLFNRCRQASENTSFVASNLMTLLLTMGESFDSQDLSRANIPGAELNGSHLTNCILDGANLSKCRMSNAVLKASSLNNCNLAGAIFNGADFSETHGEEINFTGCIGSSANLSHTEFQRSIIFNCNFEDSDFNSCIMTGANVKSTDFSGCDISYGEFENCVFEDCIFDNSTMTSTSFKGSKLIRCTFHGVLPSSLKLSGADLSKSIFDKIELPKIKLGNARLNEASFIGADLTAAHFTDSDLRQCNLRGANVSRCDFRGVDMSGAILRDCDLSDSHLEGANLANVDLSKVQANVIHLDKHTNLKGIEIDEKTILQLPKNLVDALIEQNPHYGQFLKRPKYRNYDD
jgi:uncharacterized protein YjbI with pentapeptide repeats